MQQPPVLRQRHPRRSFAMPLNTGVYPRLPGFMLLFGSATLRTFPCCPADCPRWMFPDSQVRTQCADGPGGRKHVIVVELSPLSPPLAVAEELTTSARYWLSGPLSQRPRCYYGRVGVRVIVHAKCTGPVIPVHFSGIFTSPFWGMDSARLWVEHQNPPSLTGLLSAHSTVVWLISLTKVICTDVNPGLRQPCSVRHSSLLSCGVTSSICFPAPSRSGTGQPDNAPAHSCRSGCPDFRINPGTPLDKGHIQFSPAIPVALAKAADTASAYTVGKIRTKLIQRLPYTLAHTILSQLLIRHHKGQCPRVFPRLTFAGNTGCARKRNSPLAANSPGNSPNDCPESDVRDNQPVFHCPHIHANTLTSTAGDHAPASSCPGLPKSRVATCPALKASSPEPWRRTHTDAQ